jgi:hypothetical protein
MVDMFSGIHFAEAFLHTEFILGVISRRSQEPLHALLLLQGDDHLVGALFAPDSTN